MAAGDDVSRGEVGRAIENESEADFTSWDRAGLERRLADALEVAEHAVELLASHGFDEDRPDGLRREKLVSETGVFLVAAYPACAQNDELRRRHEGAASSLVPHARNDRVAARMVLEPSVALDHALAHLCLTRSGLPDARFDTLLHATRAHGTFGARERLPYRQLEQAWLGHLAGVDLAPVTPENGILANPVDVLSGTTDDVYALTHTLMYQSHFGTRPVVLPRARADVVAEAEAALAWCLDEQNYDVAGELVLAWPLLGQAWSPESTFGFRCLMHVDDLAGFLPSPGISLTRLNQFSGLERERCALAMTYHTIYVMGILCALCLHHGRTPPKSLPTSSFRIGAAAALLEAVPLVDENRHWQALFAQLTSSERDAIASLLMTIMLRRAASRRDLAAIRRILVVAAEFDLLYAPAARQALELLQRTALLGELHLVATETPPTVPV